MTDPGPKSWTMPDVPHPAGATELAEVIANWCTFTGNAPDLDLIRRLITLAYHVSMAEEEGRYPRFRVYAPSPIKNGNFDRICTFDPPIPIRTVEDLRRLAPAVRSLDYALWVEQQEEGTTKCTGIIRTGDDGSAAPIGSPIAQSLLGRPVGLVIRVDRPGELRVSFDALVLRLRRGNLRPIYHVYYSTAVRSLLQDVVADIQARLRTRLDEEQLKRFGGPDGGLFLEGLSRILTGMIEGGAGGALVVLPAQTGQGLVEPKYQIDGLCLSRTIAEYWVACVEATDCTDVNTLRRHAGREWSAQQGRLFHAAKVVATLSKVDGCVVADRRLTVTGFGGEILVNEKAADSSGLTYSEDCLGAIPENELEKLGTRNKSALRLCKAVPGALVFVASQDGDLRVFSSNFKHVFAVECDVSSRAAPAW